ncbi:MAG: hypothetical protein C4321_10685, partial [Chloroflexota bacterium]
PGPGLLQPAPHDLARSAQNPLAKRNNQPRLFRDRDEIQRRDQSVTGVSPAGQRLEPGQTAGCKLNDGLEVKLELLAFERERQPDLVVMATHGRGGLSRVIFGSVAEHVLREGNAPVMLIRPPEPEEKG